MERAARGVRQETWHSGYVLHSRPYRETSVLIDFLCVDQGRIGLVFRGVKTGAKKNIKGRLLQPFQPLLMSWAGGGELKNGRQVENNGLSYVFQGLPLYSALYVNELLVRLLPRDEAFPALFSVYEQALFQLQDIARAAKPRTAMRIDLEQTLRQFEFNLLAELGYGIAFEQTAEGHDIESGQWYRYDADMGFVPALIQERARQDLFRGSVIMAIGLNEWDKPEVLADAKRLSRKVLAPHLGGAPLQSRALFT